MSIGFWLSLACLSPVLVPQAKHSRRAVLRLPEASGNSRGQWGNGTTDRRILLLGDSTAAGVGVSDHQQGLACELARSRHRVNGETVAWQTWGLNGGRLADLLTNLPEQSLPQADTLIISIGVNDVTALTRRQLFRDQLQALAAQLQQSHPGRPLHLMAVPPMQHFLALPRPLRGLLGWRARLLDGEMRKLSRQHPDRFCHLSYPPLCAPALLAADGFHPSEEGYRCLAAAVSQRLARLDRETDDLPTATARHTQ